MSSIYVVAISTGYMQIGMIGNIPLSTTPKHGKAEYTCSPMSANFMRGINASFLPVGTDNTTLPKCTALGPTLTPICTGTVTIQGVHCPHIASLHMHRVQNSHPFRAHCVSSVDLYSQGAPMNVERLGQLSFVSPHVFTQYVALRLRHADTIDWTVLTAGMPSSVCSILQTTTNGWNSTFISSGPFKLCALFV